MNDKEKLIEEAARMIAEFAAQEGPVDAFHTAKVMIGMFEKAHTPTGDERPGGPYAPGLGALLRRPDAQEAIARLEGGHLPALDRVGYGMNDSARDIRTIISALRAAGGAK